MEIQYAIDPTDRLVRYTVRGLPTVDSVRQLLASVTSDPSFQRGFGFLADYRGVDCDLSAAYIRSFARDVRTRAPLLGTCRWAVLCSTPGVFAAVRLCIILTHGCGIEFAPFTVEADATAWIQPAPELHTSQRS